MADKKELNLNETEKISGGVVELAGGFKPFISVQQTDTPALDTNTSQPSGDGDTNTLNQNNNNNNQGIQSNQQGGSGTQKNVQSIQTQGDVKL